MKYRNSLPQLAGVPMLADGGLETHLVFKDGIDLPLFAAFTALHTETGRMALDRYMESFAQLAQETGRGFLMDTPTWRASARWAADLGVSRDELAALHTEVVVCLSRLRERYELPGLPFVINGVIGPYSDGYAPTEILSAEAAERYHTAQASWFAEAGADMISAITMTYPGEAIGISRAALEVGLPAAVSFTVETDGRLPSGHRISEAIEAVDAATDCSVAYYMLNCAHPDHFRRELEAAQFGGGDWHRRIRGLRVNASRLSHAELDASETLDDGDHTELGALHRPLAALLPNLTVVGGCCGTDHRHVAAICDALREPAQSERARRAELRN